MGDKLRGPAVFTAVALSIVCVISSCGDSGPSGITLLGCDEVRRGPICLLAPGKTTIGLAVETLAGAELTLQTAKQPLRFDCDGAEGERCFAQAAGSVLKVSLPSSREHLQLVIKTPGLSLGRKFDLEVTPKTLPLPWIAESVHLRIAAGQPKQAEDLLREKLRPDSKPELRLSERAQALSELAQSLQEQLHVDEAEVAFREAIGLDEQAGLLSQKAADLMSLTDMLYDQRRLYELERLLDANQEVFQLVGRWRPWPSLYRAQNAQSLGDLDLALRQLDQADRVNHLCGDERSINTTTLRRSEVRAALGFEREDAFIREAAKALAGFPCRLGLLLRRQAALRISLLESELGEAVQPDAYTLGRLGELWKRWESSALPEPATLLDAHNQRLEALLDASLSTLKKQCAIPRHLGMVMLSQARLALLMRNPQRAADLLASVRSLLATAQVDPDRSPTFSVEWNSLSAALARAQGRYDDALRYTNFLAKYSGEDVNSFEIKWTLLYGRALALWNQGEAHRDEALAAIRAANATIEDASHSAPLLLSRGPLLGRFEWGSRLLLELLLRIDKQGQPHASQQELQEVLQRMRTLRMRPLAGLQRLERVQRLGPAARQQWTGAVVEYLAARRQLEQAQQAGIEPEKRLAQRQEQVSQHLIKALAVLGDVDPLRPRLMQEDEALLICHPLYQRWACLAGNERQVYVTTLLPDELLQPALTEDGTSVLLSRLAEPLRRAKVLSVLGYGAFRHLSVEQLPFAGRPLGEQLTVRYSLDITTSAAPIKDPRAVIAIDAKLEYTDASEQPLLIGAPLLAALQQGHGFQPKLLNLGLHGTVGGSALTAAKIDLRQEIASAGLLLLFGHMDYAPGSGWINGINWTKWSRLTGGDIMISIDAVPARVILIACSSGANEDILGGHEALGLAQAFLLRGSQEVLATTREITAEAGTLVAKKVLEHLAATPQDSLAKALAAVTAELTYGLPHESTERVYGDGTTERSLRQRVRPQLDAFRVLNP